MMDTLTQSCGDEAKKASDNETVATDCVSSGSAAIEETLSGQKPGMLEGCLRVVRKAPEDYQTLLSEWSSDATQALRENVLSKVNEVVDSTRETIDAQSKFNIADGPLLMRNGTQAFAPVFVIFALASIASMGVVFAWRRATSSALGDGTDELLPIVSESDAA